MMEGKSGRKQIGLVVSAGSVISLLLGLNAWFLSRLVETLDSTTKTVAELRIDVAVLKSKLKRRDINEDDH